MGHTLSLCCGRRPQTQGELQQQQNETPFELPSASLLLSDLPSELLLHNILPHLTYVDLCSLSQVNKRLKILIDTNDQLWKSAIKNEMLDELQPNDDNDEDQQQQQFQVFKTEKAKFQYLYEQRRKQPLTCVTYWPAHDTWNSPGRLYCKYATIRSSINDIKKEKAHHKLYIYYYHGEPQNNFELYRVDNQSRGLIGGFVNVTDWTKKMFEFTNCKISCLKCKFQPGYLLKADSMLQPYNWFVSYSSSTFNRWRERIDVIEIYCLKCHYFSLWKNEIHGYNGRFTVPKPRKH